MARFRLQLAILFAAFAACGVARADIYGFVDHGRVSILYSDTPPADSRYRLYRKDRAGGYSERFSVATGTAGLKRTRYSSHVLAAAKETAVEPALIHAVISVESGYNPSARSRAGAVGLMQLMPETAKRYGVTDRLDPAQNIQGGARYLRDLKVMFDNKLHLVLAAYNAGEEAVVKYGMRIPPYRETVAYVPKVMSHYRKYRAAASAVPGG
jgi:soluble lytic murein transglycosylase-like protein